MLLVDTGVFLSAADRSEPRHLSRNALLRGRRDLAVVAPVVAETRMARRVRLGPIAESHFLATVTSDRFTIVDLIAADYERTRVLIGAYADLGLGFVDASIVAVAERLGLTTIATLNARDFTVARPDHCDAFELLP